jgi:hypothetical protein
MTTPFNRTLAELAAENAFPFEAECIGRGLYSVVAKTSNGDFFAEEKADGSGDVFFGEVRAWRLAPPAAPKPRTFKLRGGQPHMAGYIDEGNHLLKDDEMIYVREVLPGSVSVTLDVLKCCLQRALFAKRTLTDDENWVAFLNDLGLGERP